MANDHSCQSLTASGASNEATTGFDSVRTLVRFSRLDDMRNMWYNFCDSVRYWGIEIAIVLAILLAFTISEASEAHEIDDLHIHVEFVPYEPVVPEHENNNLLIKVNWYDTVEEVQEAVGHSDVQAYSLCEVHYEDGDDIGFCEIWVVRPVGVDDEHTKSLGHEVLHGLLGSYHAT